jgi:hypothetical protein
MSPRKLDGSFSALVLPLVPTMVKWEGMANGMGLSALGALSWRKLKLEPLSYAGRGCE